MIYDDNDAKRRDGVSMFWLGFAVGAAVFGAITLPWLGIVASMV